MSTLRPRWMYGSPRDSSASGKTGHENDLSHERIEADLAAFSAAGGHVEVLGVTPLRRKTDKGEPARHDDASARRRAPGHPGGG